LGILKTFRWVGTTGHVLNKTRGLYKCFDEFNQLFGFLFYAGIGNKYNNLGAMKVMHSNSLEF